MGSQAHHEIPFDLLRDDFKTHLSTDHKPFQPEVFGLAVAVYRLAAKIDKAVFPGQQGGPQEHSIAAKAIAFAEASETAWPRVYESCASATAGAASRAATARA